MDATNTAKIGELWRDWAKREKWWYWPSVPRIRLLLPILTKCSGSFHKESAVKLRQAAVSQCSFRRSRLISSEFLSFTAGIALGFSTGCRSLASSFVQWVMRKQALILPLFLVHLVSLLSSFTGLYRVPFLFSIFPSHHLCCSVVWGCSRRWLV